MLMDTTRIVVMLLTLHCGRVDIRIGLTGGGGNTEENTEVNSEETHSENESCHMEWQLN